MPHSGAASQLAVGFGRSVPLRGTYGETGGLLYPTAALLRSLQWVSDGRSRYAEPVGRWEVCYAPQRRCFAACSGFQTVGPATRNLWGDGRFAKPHSCAASQLAVGFRWSVPLCGTCGVWGIAVSCVRCTMTCMCCTASCGAAQCPGGTRLYETHCKLRSSAAVGICVKHHTTHVPRRGTYRVRCEMRCVMCELHYDMYVMHCVMREMRSVPKGHVYMKPTASCGAAQLWV